MMKNGQRKSACPAATGTGVHAKTSYKYYTTDVLPRQDREMKKLRPAPDKREETGVKLAAVGFAVLLIGAALADMAPLGLAALVMALGVGILWKGAILCGRLQ